MDKRESYQKTKEHSDKNAQFHWTEGNKFALESFKSLFLISSGGAVAVLGYSATTKTFTYNLGFSLLAFFFKCNFRHYFNDNGLLCEPKARKLTHT